MGRIRRREEKLYKTSNRWNTALYIRLSKEDGNDESYSVTNQRQRLNDYLEILMAENDMQLTDTYIDDGYTGTDSERYQFQRMLEDIDSGRINCVIVKDLSRLSRNDWECKKYLQQLFVIKNVRFVSLELPALDSYMHPDDIYDMGVSIQSMYNENHCRETSVKVRGTFNTKRKKGEFIGAFAPYGYQKDPDNRHHLVVDEESAAIVRDIFHWFVREGMSKNGIAKKLIDMDIPCPAAYKQQNGLKYHNPSIKTGQPLWSARSITFILTNRVYLGDMVQGKQKVRSYKIHTRISIPEKDWIVVKNTHQAIVDEAVFNIAQELLKKDTRRAPQAEKLYVFSGFLRCADCGKAMGRRVSNNHVYYACRTHTTLGLCSRHSIRDDKLQNVLLEVIRRQIELTDDLNQIIDETDPMLSSRSIGNHRTDFIKKREQELKRLKDIKVDLYLDWKKGSITEEEYYYMKKEFEGRENRVQKEYETLKIKERETGVKEENDNQNFVDFKKYRNISILDRGIVAEFVKMIYIHEGGGVTIDFRFADRHRRFAGFIADNL